MSDYKQLIILFVSAAGATNISSQHQAAGAAFSKPGISCDDEPTTSSKNNDFGI